MSDFGVFIFFGFFSKRHSNDWRLLFKSYSYTDVSLPVTNASWRSDNFSFINNTLSNRLSMLSLNDSHLFSNEPGCNASHARNIDYNVLSRCFLYTRSNSLADKMIFKHNLFQFLNVFLSICHWRTFKTRQIFDHCSTTFKVFIPCAFSGFRLNQWLSDFAL